MTQDPRSQSAADARSDASSPRSPRASREASETLSSGALPFGAGVESGQGEPERPPAAPSQESSRPSSRKKTRKRKAARKPRAEKAEEPQDRPEGRRRKTRSRPATPHEEPEEDPEAGEVRVWKKFRLSAFQIRAIDAIAAGHNVLVAAPTGAGKTLVAEYAIEDAVRRGKRCIYTAPIKALSNQKYRDFRDDPEIDVGLMTGDVTIRPEAQVLIMTTEILRNAIFENPEYLSDVEFAIFDEVHFLDDPERGSVWEECLIFAPKTVRVICLSATIDNLEEVGDWLTEIRDQEVHVIRSDKRPVPLTHRFWTAGSGVVEPREIGRLRKTEGKAPKKPSSHGRSRHGHGPTSNSRRDKNNERSMRRKERMRDERPPSLAPLLDELQARQWMPTLVFCFSRKECEYQAHDNLSRELLNTAEKRQMEALQHDLIELFDLPESAYDSALFAMARRGIAYHHAGMLPAEKEFVERLFTTGTVKLLFATETFAVGINMPARCVVFRSLRKFDGVSFDYMRTRDYLQMAGRAGRQGIDDEGLVFSVLAPKDLREAPIERFLEGRSEPVKSRFGLAFSTLLHLVEKLGRGRVAEAFEKSLSSFQHKDRKVKLREKNDRRQLAQIDARLDLLEELGYLEGEDLLPRGRFAKHINGYELQLTELVFRGHFETLGAEALVVIFCGLIYEERRRGDPTWIPRRLYGNERRHVDEIARELRFQAIDRELSGSDIKLPDWGLTRAAVAWCRGATFDEIEEEIEAPPGDVVRCLRMSLQLMRQTRRALQKEDDLNERLSEAMALLNRDEIDARRQLELG